MLNWAEKCQIEVEKFEFSWILLKSTQLLRQITK